MSRYGNIIDSFGIEKMDGAFFGSFTGALAIEKLGVVPLARPVNLDNTSTYHGKLFVRKDGKIRTVGDMKGKRMAYVDKATTAGYIFPLAYLRRNGVADTDKFFGEFFFTGSHDAAIDAVLTKKADVGAGKHSIFERVRKENHRVDQELLVLAESPRVPSNGLCVRKTLDEGLKRKLKEALLGIHSDHAARKARAAGCVLQIGRLGRAARPQLGVPLRQLVECGLRSDEGEIDTVGRLAQETRKWLDAIAAEAPQPCSRPRNRVT